MITSQPTPSDRPQPLTPFRNQAEKPNIIYKKISEPINNPYRSKRDQRKSPVETDRYKVTEESVDKINSSAYESKIDRISQPALNFQTFQNKSNNDSLKVVNINPPSIKMSIKREEIQTLHNDTNSLDADDPTPFKQRSSKTIFASTMQGKLQHTNIKSNEVSSSSLEK